MLLASISTIRCICGWNGHAAGNINYPIAIFIIFILVAMSGCVWRSGVSAEYFPAGFGTRRCRPYHIGNGWVAIGAFITSAAFAAPAASATR